MKKYIAIFLLTLTIISAPFILFGQDTGAEDLPLTSLLVNSLIGVLIYYATKASKAIITGNFDWKYWFKDNWIQLAVTLVALILITYFSIANPDLLNQILALINFQIDTTEPIGSVAFGTIFAGVFYEVIKKFIPKKGYVETDGAGEEIR